MAKASVPGSEPSRKPPATSATTLKFGFQDLNHNIDKLDVKMDNTLNKLEAMMDKIGTQLSTRGFLGVSTTPYTPHISVGS